MNAPLTPDQEKQVRAIVAEMIGQALNGAGARVAAAVSAAAPIDRGLTDYSLIFADMVDLSLGGRR